MNSNAALHCALCFCALVSIAQQASAQFSEVFTVPPDSLDPLRFMFPEEDFDYIVSDGQQLNLVGDPGVFISDIFVDEGGELNYSLVGDVAAVPTAITVWSGGTANLAGSGPGDFRVEDGGVGRVLDGAMGFINMLVSSGGAGFVKGGEVRELVIDASTVSVTGGSIDALIIGQSGNADPALDVSGGTLLDVVGETTNFLLSGHARLSGGDWSFDSAFVNVNRNGFLEFVGSSFAIDGAPVSGLLPGETLEITSRNSTLSGVLADGSPFSIALVEDADADAGLAGVDPLGSVVVTLAIPEPQSVALVLTAAVSLLAGRRGCIVGG